MFSLESLEEGVYRSEETMIFSKPTTLGNLMLHYIINSLRMILILNSVLVHRTSVP